MIREEVIKIPMKVHDCKIDVNIKNKRDYSVETLWHNDKIISTAVMQKKKLIAFEFNTENI